MGVIVGGLLELIWINSLPLGGYVPPNDCLAAVVITAGLILADFPGASTDRPFIAFGVLVGLPVARIAAFMESQTRRANDILARRALLAATDGRPEQVSWFNAFGLIICFLSSTAFILIASPLLVVILKHIYPVLPSPALEVLDVMFFCLPLFGISAVLSNINVKNSTGAFVVSFYVMFILLNL